MNVNLFKSELIKNGYTQASLAKKIGISQSTLNRKLRNNSFTIEEAEAIIKILGIAQPSSVFFTTE